jgi:cyclic pyranopterin phosphate synthase
MTAPTKKLTHLDERGHARMVDVGEKAITARSALARARVSMSPESFEALSSGATPKGDVLAAARIAGIQASKLTPQLIPLCHSVHLTRVEVTIRLEHGAAIVDAKAEALDRTGVEMEALVAASTAALTIYDMLKAIDRSMYFEVRLIEKSGGRKGPWARPDETSSADGQAP